MENEVEGPKDGSVRTDGGFSERKMDKQVDRGLSLQAKMGQIFTPKKKPQVVFQAQKDDEK